MPDEMPLTLVRSVTREASGAISVARSPFTAGQQVQDWGGAAFAWADQAGNPAKGTTIWSIGAVLGGVMAAGAIALQLPLAVHLGISTAVFSSAYVERTERGDANFLSMARGGCALALQHGSLDKLKG